MALSAENLTETIDIVVSADPAVNCDGEEYAKYLEDLDVNRLGIKDIEPTVFVMKKMVPWGEIGKIKKEQVSIRPDKDGNQNVEFNIGYTLSEVRATLIDIKNPGKGFEFKKDGDGKASKSLMEKIEAIGATMDLFNDRQNALTKRDNPKKK